jgi:hypothetical protein
MNQKPIITKAPRPVSRLLYIFGATPFRRQEKPNLWDIDGIFAQNFLEWLGAISL